jgi:DNA-binding NarL/FixJ family response regulator
MKNVKTRSFSANENQKNFLLFIIFMIILVIITRANFMIRIVVIVKLKQERKKTIALLVSQDNFQIITTGKDGYDALRAAECQPDIIIMDMCLPDIDGPLLAPMIKRKSPSTAIIAISAPKDENLAGWALKRGISGYILKDTDMDNLAASVKIVSDGGWYISPPIILKMINHYSLLAEISDSTRGSVSPPDFSPIECQIIDGIACGFSDEEIAEDLGISVGTLRNYLAAAKRKTGLRNRTQMVLYALMCGLIKFSHIQKEILDLL